MAQFETSNIRTLALVGHGAAGKTTLAESLLAAAGALSVSGSVERGTTVSDFDPLEKSYRHSLRASILHVEHAGDARAFHRHPRLSGFHRPGDRRARRG